MAQLKDKQGYQLFSTKIMLYCIKFEEVLFLTFADDGLTSSSFAG